MKKFLLLFLPLCTFLLLILFSASLSPSKITTTNNNPTGKVVINVFSGATPLQNATVCIIETAEYFYTNSSGSTETITLPTEEKKAFQNNKDKPFTEYTLLVYKNGYLPHIYYGLKITSNQTKIGVIINLTEYGIKENITHTESYEFPPSSYAENLIIKYKNSEP